LAGGHVAGMQSGQLGSKRAERGPRADPRKALARRITCVEKALNTGIRVDEPLRRPRELGVRGPDRTVVGGDLRREKRARRGQVLPSSVGSATRKKSSLLRCT